MKTLISITMLIVATILTSSYSILKDDEGVPPDYGSKETTLIIIKLTKMKRQNEKIIDVFTDNYKGKFVMEDTLDEKYNDVDKYGYVFTPRAFWNEASGSGETRMAAYWSYSGTLTDRSTGTKYPIGYQGGAYGPFYKSYAKRLEKVRAKNAAN
jgi:hypothetical protein